MYFSTANRRGLCSGKLSGLAGPVPKSFVRRSQKCSVSASQKPNFTQTERSAPMAAKAKTKEDELGDIALSTMRRPSTKSKSKGSKGKLVGNKRFPVPAATTLAVHAKSPPKKTARKPMKRGRWHAEQDQTDQGRSGDREESRTCRHHRRESIRQRYGRATKTPPDERRGNRHARPNATAPHSHSTPLRKFGSRLSMTGVAP